MIDIKNITFGYTKNQPVMQDFSLQIPTGGVYGLLGKNGTGKSTLLYLLTGLLRAQQGSVAIDGFAPQKRQPELFREVFLVPEEYDLPDAKLSDYVKALKIFYPRFDEELLSSCLQEFELNMDIDLGALSMGQKKKAYMCIALAANTRYLFMDEPTNGLDILSKSQFRKVVVRCMTDDKTILISTHQVHDVERLLDHVIIVGNNGVLYNEPLVESDDAPINLEKLFIEVLTHHELS